MNFSYNPVSLKLLKQLSVLYVLLNYLFYWMVEYISSTFELWGQTAWIQILAFPLRSCVALGTF